MCNIYREQAAHCDIGDFLLQPPGAGYTDPDESGNSMGVISIVNEDGSTENSLANFRACQISVEAVEGNFEVVDAWVREQ